MKKNDEFKILIVDDEISYSEALCLALESEGYNVSCCNEPQKVPAMVEEGDYDLIISDLIMPGMNGVELLREVKFIRPELYVIILTGFGTIENAVEAIKYGAFNYVIKGSDIEQLLNEIENIKKISKKNSSPEMIEDLQEYVLTTNNEKYRHVLELAGKAAKSNANILILGESGVGKEVIANYIYTNSNRSDEKFIISNTHTYSSNLLESELFGHEKGAFTGALTQRIGLFEAAQKGTLFLDEIGDIFLETQAKLLRAIETKKITRIGSNDEIQVDFRLITATNKNLEKEIEEGRFREDLYFRISTIVLNVPPLRHRKEDLPDLIEFFTKKNVESLGIEEIKLPHTVMEKLLAYNYPGNVRELKNIIERLIVLSDNGKVREDILSEVFRDTSDSSWDEVSNKQLSLKELRQEIESKYISDLLHKNNNDIGKTADTLGISKRHLFNKLQEYHLGGSEHNDENQCD